MSLLYPTIYVDKAYDISIETLKKLKITGVLLDVDNTLTIDKGTKPDERMLSWLENLRSNGIKMMIVSNGKHKRLSKFSKTLDLPCFSMAMKPLPFKLKKAARMVANSTDDVLLIGDQIFTDILGANTCGIKSALVNPIKTETSASFKIRRYFECGIREKIRESD